MDLIVTVSDKFEMANPDQKTILIDQAIKDINDICKRFKDDSGSSNSEVKTLLKELASSWETEEKNKFGFN